MNEAPTSFYKEKVADTLLVIGMTQLAGPMGQKSLIYSKKRFSLKNLFNLNFEKSLYNFIVGDFGAQNLRRANYSLVKPPMGR